MSKQAYVEYLSEVELTERDIPARHPVRLFADHWRNISTDGSVPEREDFSPVNVPELLPYVVVHELVETDEGPDLRTRLEGEFFVSLTGKSNRGHTRRQVLSEDRFQTRIQETKDVLDTGNIRYTIVELVDHNRKQHKIFRGVFPFRKGSAKSAQVFVVVASEDFAL